MRPRVIAFLVYFYAQHPWYASHWWHAGWCIFILLSCVTFWFMYLMGVRLRPVSLFLSCRSHVCHLMWMLLFKWHIMFLSYQSLLREWRYAVIFTMHVMAFLTCWRSVKSRNISHGVVECEFFQFNNYWALFKSWGMTLKGMTRGDRAPGL